MRLEVGHAGPDDHSSLVRNYEEGNEGTGQRPIIPAGGEQVVSGGILRLLSRRFALRACRGARRLVVGGLLGFSACCDEVVVVGPGTAAG